MNDKQPGSGRNAAIDLLRGLVMVLMALDHARDFYGDMRLDPVNMATTTPFLFFTRFVTHFCAPVFVFLAGVGAYFYGARRTRGALTRFLVSRGVWLIVLDLTLIYYGWVMSFHFGWVFFQVVSAIGAAMILLAGFAYLPRGVLWALTLVVLLGHNLLDLTGEWQLANQGWWGALAYGGPFTPIVVGETPRLWVIYGIVPWTAVLFLGYGMGPLLQKPAAERRAVFFKLGAALTAAFFVLRGLDLYGDPNRFAEHLATAAEAQEVESSSLAMTIVAFFNTTKYPPSLLYLLMTLGPAFLLVAWVDTPRRLASRIGGMLVTFGRVPLFYYLAHIFLIHLGARAYNLVVHGEGYSPFRALFDSWFNNLPLSESYGNGLGLVYAGWIVTVVVLYPLCAWYARVKGKGRSALWSYL